MYIHLGRDTVIKMNDIVGIFDIETSTISNITRKYLSKSQKSGNIVNVSMEMPKSFVLCCDKKKKVTVYITQISSATLLKRTGYVD